MHKRLVSILIAFLVGSIVMVGFQFGSCLSVPSVPEFSLSFVAYPYEVPPTYIIEPNTGQSTLKDSGFVVQNRSIEVTIKNQPYNATLDASGNQTALHYNIRYREHSAASWITYYVYGGYPEASGDAYTTILVSNTYLDTLENGSQIDVEVQALVGYDYLAFEGPACSSGSCRPSYMTAELYYNFSGVTGEWSSIQTVKINDPSITQTPYPIENSTPTPPQFASQTDALVGLNPQSLAIISLVLAVVGLVAVVAFQHRRHRKMVKQTPP
jgi:hypothetical protein